MNIDHLIDSFNAEGIDRVERTRDWYATRIRGYLEFLAGEGTAIHLAGAADIKRFLATLRKQNASWSTRNGTHTALRVFYRWLVDRGYVEVNPFEVEQIERPRKPRKIRILPPMAAVPNVINVMDEDDSARAQRDMAMLLVLLDAGLRREEVTQLDIRNVNLATGRIAVLIAKGENQRFGYIEQPTIQIVTRWLDVHPRPEPKHPLFVALEGPTKHKRINPRTVNRILKSWSDKAGLVDHLRPHDLRRLFGTIFSQTGGGSKVLQDLMGHANLETTEGYIINTEGECRRQHKRHSPVNLLDFKGSEEGE